jgi:hypothetical protein
MYCCHWLVDALTFRPWKERQNAVLTAVCHTVAVDSGKKKSTRWQENDRHRREDNVSYKEF